MLCVCDDECLIVRLDALTKNQHIKPRMHIVYIVFQKNISNGFVYVVFSDGLVFPFIAIIVGIFYNCIIKTFSCFRLNLINRKLHYI